MFVFLHVDHVSWAGLELTEDCLLGSCEIWSREQQRKYSVNVHRQTGGREGWKWGQRRKYLVLLFTASPAYTQKCSSRKPNFPFLRLRYWWWGSVRQYSGSKGTGCSLTALTLLGHWVTLALQHYWPARARGQQSAVSTHQMLFSFYQGWCESLLSHSCGREKSAPTLQPPSFTETLLLLYWMSLPVHSIQWRNVVMRYRMCQT